VDFVTFLWTFGVSVFFISAFMNRLVMARRIVLAQAGLSLSDCSVCSLAYLRSFRLLPLVLGTGSQFHSSSLDWMDGTLGWVVGRNVWNDEGWACQISMNAVRGGRGWQ